MRTVTLIRVAGEITEPWLIGATAADATINIPVLVDPRTNVPVLPATTLVGSLREHLGPAVADEWLGPRPVEHGDPDRTPSRLRVSPVALDATADDRRLVAGTSIDGRRRAGKGQGLRQEQVVQRNDNQPTRFGWTLEHAGAPDPVLVDALAGWSARVGRGQTVGRGSMRVSSVTAYGLDLDQPDQLTWWLSRRVRAIFGDPLAAQIPMPPGVAPIHADSATNRQPAGWQRRFEWMVVDPLHVGGTDPGQRSDGDRAAVARPVRRQSTSGKEPGRPVVPGSAWKGIFRHRTEQILNLIGAAAVQDIVGTLFGAPGQSRGPGDGRRGLLTFHSSEVRGKNSAGPNVRSRTHVSIDRVSGGAADGRLFALESVRGGRFDLVISSTTAVPTSVENLLAHVVLDLHEGLIGVGAATTRGYGTIRLSQNPPSVDRVDVADIQAQCARLRGAR